MKMVLAGLTGWTRMREHATQEVRTVDGAITVVATLLALVTWALVRR